MKKITVLLSALIIVFLSVTTVTAQASEGIWLEANTTAYKTGEIVSVRLYAASVTPIQGFTFQISYDPNCLEPINASSPVSGMNGLQLPQTVGLVDASFASTTPQAATGVLAETTFLALGGCQTSLHLESAALAIRDASGFAAPLSGIEIGERNIALNIDKTVGEAQDQVLLGEPLSLEPSESSNKNTPDWAAIIVGTLLLLVVGIVVAVVVFALYKRSKIGVNSRG